MVTAAKSSQIPLSERPPDRADYETRRLCMGAFRGTFARYRLTSAREAARSHKGAQHEDEMTRRFRRVVL